MAANNWKEKAELADRVASARRKAKFARTAPTAAIYSRAREMVSAELAKARTLKNKIESCRTRKA